MLFFQHPWDLIGASDKNISVGGDYFQEVGYSGLWYPKFSKNIRITWLFQYSYFVLFTMLKLYVCLLLKLWKVDIIPDLSKYLLFIFGFYKRSVLFFLYGLESESYFKNLLIWNIVFWCSGAEVGLSSEYRNYRSKEILMNHGDYEAGVVS